MGLLSFFEKKTGGIETGQCAITADDLLGLDDQAISPSRPPQFSILRTAPVPKEPMKLTQAQANALGRMAEVREIQSKANEQGYAHLKRIKRCDVKDQQNHNDYLRFEAKGTFKQATSNANTGNAIAGLASKYAGLHESVQHRLELEKAKNQAISGKTAQQAAQFSQLW